MPAIAELITDVIAERGASTPFARGHASWLPGTSASATRSMRHLGPDRAVIAARPGPSDGGVCPRPAPRPGNRPREQLGEGRAGRRGRSGRCASQHTAARVAAGPGAAEQPADEWWDAVRTLVAATIGAGTAAVPRPGPGARRDMRQRALSDAAPRRRRRPAARPRAPVRRPASGRRRRARRRPRRREPRRRRVAAQAPVARPRAPGHASPNADAVRSARSRRVPAHRRPWPRPSQRATDRRPVRRGPARLATGRVCRPPASTPTALPPLRRAGEVLGVVTAGAAGASGLPAGTPVVVGMGDTPAELLGAGVVEPGEVLLYYGTTTSVDVCTHSFEEYLRDPSSIADWAPYREVAYAVLGPVLPVGRRRARAARALGARATTSRRWTTAATRIAPSARGSVRRSPLPRPRPPRAAGPAPGDRRPRRGPLQGRPPPGRARVVRVRDARGTGGRWAPAGTASVHRDRRWRGERVLAPARERRPRSRADVAAGGRRRARQRGARRLGDLRERRVRAGSWRRDAGATTRSRTRTGTASRTSGSGRGAVSATRSREPSRRRRSRDRRRRLGVQPLSGVTRRKTRRRPDRPLSS